MNQMLMNFDFFKNKTAFFFEVKQLFIPKIVGLISKDNILINFAAVISRVKLCMLKWCG